MRTLIALLTMALLLSCSNDTIEPNAFKFDGKYYPVANLLVQEGINNQTRLIFMDLNDAESGLPKTIVEINIDSPSLEETVHDVVTGGNYRFQAKPFFDEDVYDYNTTILDSSMPEDLYQIGGGTVNVTKLDDAAIELSVQITRADGAVITGNYLGLYHQ